MVRINDENNRTGNFAPRKKFYCRTRRFQILATGGATVGAFGLGTVLAWTSPAIPSLDAEKQFGVISADTKAMLASLVPLGALVSCPLTGYLVDRIGRKTTMLLMSAPFVLGWLLITYARSLVMMNIGRFLTGFCSGAFSIAAPLFISEIAQDDIRGMLGTGYQIMVTFGILFTYVLGAFVNWEILALTCGFLPLAFLVLMIFMPESPRYFLIKGNVKEAKEALRWLRGADNVEIVEEELQMIQYSIDASQIDELNIHTWKKPKFLKPTLLVLGLFFIQQCSGINYVIFFSKSIFGVAGATEDSASSVIIVGFVQFAGTLVSGALVDRVGRRILLIISSSFMGVSLTAIGVFFYLKDTDKYISEMTSWLPLVSLMLFIVAYSLGYGPVPLLLMAEFLPLNRKGIFCGVCTSFNWALAFLITQFIASLEEAITIQWCFWSFAACCFVGTIFVIHSIPETKGKSLDEIQDYFDKENKTHHIK